MPATPRCHGRKPWPEHLPRREVEHRPAECACTRCGGVLRQVGTDATEVPEYVPGRFEVIRHVRPAYSCRSCEAMCQAPMPSLPIARGRPGPGLLAHVLVSKYADHLPLHRQSEIYARDGVELERATMAAWVGKAATLMRSLIDALARHVMAAERLHADDTPVPVLAPGAGRTKTGRFGQRRRTRRRHLQPDHHGQAERPRPRGVSPSRAEPHRRPPGEPGCRPAAMAVSRALQAGRDRYEVVYDVDPRNDDTMWEIWIEGFARAIALRPSSWDSMPHPTKAPALPWPG